MPGLAISMEKTSSAQTKTLPGQKVFAWAQRSKSSLDGYCVY
jgi:hypothetical protein